MEMKEKKKLSQLELMKQDNEKLINENTELKRSVTSYKGENTKLRQKVQRLIDTCREGDKMYEQAKQEVYDRMAVIRKLNDEIDKLVKERQVIGLDRDHYKKIVELPWYKRIFIKG